MSVKLTVNEKLTEKNGSGVRVVLECEDPQALLEPAATTIAREKAAELGLMPSGIGNIPSPYAVNEATDGPVTGPQDKAKCFRVEIMCVPTIPV